jgi:WD40 repeat protein
MWSLEDGAEIRRFEGHDGYVYSACVTPDGRHLVTGSGDKTARRWALVE